MQRAPSAPIAVVDDPRSAIAQASDALPPLFVHLVSEGEPLPQPSRPKRGQACAVLPPRAAAKLTIDQAMQDAGLTQAAPAKRLGCNLRQVRRLLGVDHHSRPDQLEAALSAHGKPWSWRWRTRRKRASSGAPTRSWVVAPEVAMLPHRCPGAR